MNLTERVVARYLQAARPGPLLQKVLSVLPVWARHLSDKTYHTFTPEKPKPVKQRGRSGFQVVLTSQYSSDDNLTAVFVSRDDGGLDLTVKHRKNTHSYEDVRPDRLPEDQLIRDLKIDLGPETPVWYGVGVTEVTTVGLDYKVVDDMLEGEAEGVIDDRLAEVMSNEREASELISYGPNPFEDFWDLWDARDPQVKKFLREKLETLVIADRPTKKTLVDAVSPRRVEEAIRDIRTMGYFRYG